VKEVYSTFPPRKYILRYPFDLTSYALSFRSLCRFGRNQTRLLFKVGPPPGGERGVGGSGRKYRHKRNYHFSGEITISNQKKTVKENHRAYIEKGESVLRFF